MQRNNWQKEMGDTNKRSYGYPLDTLSLIFWTFMKYPFRISTGWTVCHMCF